MMERPTREAAAWDSVDAPPLSRRESLAAEWRLAAAPMRAQAAKRGQTLPAANGRISQ